MLLVFDRGGYNELSCSDISTYIYMNLFGASVVIVVQFAIDSNSEIGYTHDEHTRTCTESPVDRVNIHVILWL